MTEISPMSDAATKAATLIEALPWLRRYHGRVIVVKFGGNAMGSDELVAAFVDDIIFLHLAGIHPVVVHGGGPQITRALEAAGIASEFRGGYRYTSVEAMGVVAQVLRDEVNQQLVNRFTAAGVTATGLWGQDDELFLAQRRHGEPDLGRVGDVVRVNPASLAAALKAGSIPVVASIGRDLDDDGLLNLNADAAAGAIASALGAAKLIVLTDVAGLYRDWPNTQSLISRINVTELAALLPGLDSGMIPKMRACLDAVMAGVSRAAIIDGRIAHSILLEIFTARGSGTEVYRGD